jgi:hypothetical protein
METLFAATVLGTLLFGDGLPSREEREYREHEMRVCAAGGNYRADLNARTCIINEMRRKKAELLNDIKQGRWSR